MIDGIFAIAMTILVLGISPPKPDISQAPALLAGQIMDLLPEILLFIISFLILAGFWLSHHHQFYFVRFIDSRLLWINIFLLISLVFVPFSTDIAGDYPDIFIAVPALPHQYCDYRAYLLISCILHHPIRSSV